MSIDNLSISVEFETVGQQLRQLLEAGKLYTTTLPALPEGYTIESCVERVRSNGRLNSPVLIVGQCLISEDREDLEYLLDEFSTLWD